MIRNFDRKKIAEDYSKHCETADTVFQVSYDSDSDISVKSLTTGLCEMTLLTLTHFPQEMPHIWITNITTDSNGQYTFASTVNDKILFIVNGTEAYQWQSIGIYALALSIIVPSSSQISIHLSTTDQSTDYINVVSSGIQKGIMTSPSYCGFEQTFSRNSLYETDTEFSFLVDFVVKDIFGNPMPILESNGNNQTLLQNVSLLTWKFALKYAETDPKNNGFLIEYTIHGDIPIPTESTENTTTEFPITNIFSSSPISTSLPSTTLSHPNTSVTETTTKTASTFSSTLSSS
uniref:Uncharacterized protein n=1 Tax=Panagrolaimus sp. PS1159 TaxID=55785 RepID=A0AC35F0W3_9BILA